MVETLLYLFDEMRTLGYDVDLAMSEHIILSSNNRFTQSLIQLKDKDPVTNLSNL